MDYKGLQLEEEGNSLRVAGVRDFDPVHTFECGQCFRWKKCGDGSFTGIAGGKAINIAMQGNELVLRNTNLKDFIEYWHDYLDLGRDYSTIKSILVEKDAIMKQAVEAGWGIRLLRQDIWEALISFISSTNKRIPMIMQIVEKLARAYGEEVPFEDQLLHSFPTKERLAACCAEELEICGGGYRCKYISGTSKMLLTGEVKLEMLPDMATDDARQVLTLLPGVGNKVADCTLLYSGTKYDVFPTDVWVKRVMEALYFKREATFREIQEFAADYFGELAGFAQQYLFYYARENKIGVG